MHELANIISVENISFSYGTDPVLNGISLDVPHGNYLGVIGPNGAGKTTLLKIILGLLRPATGSVKLFGTDIAHFKDRAKIGYVPQKVTNFDPSFPATVGEVVLMGRYARRGMFHRITSEDRARAITALCQTDMEEYCDRLIGDLSAGQQQRVFIARALATEPEVILLDEPMTGVDEKTRGEFYALLKKLNRELHLTLVLISHDVEMVTREASHIACINRELTCHATAADFLRENYTVDLYHHHT